MSKSNKLHNTKTIVDGIRFDSKKEAKRFLELQQMLANGEISNLELQKPFVLIPPKKRSDGKTERACKYLADFVYVKDGKTITEDIKGCKFGATYNLFIIKRKLMLFIHGITVIEL